MTKDATARGLDVALTDRVCIGEILICKTNGGFDLSHRDDEARIQLMQLLEVAPDRRVNVGREKRRYGDVGPRPFWCELASE